MSLEYAVMIDTRAGVLTRPAIGLYNGSFALVTGRDGYGATAIGPGAAFVSEVEITASEVSFMLDAIGPEDLPLDFEILGNSAINPPENPNTGSSQKVWKTGMISQHLLSHAEEAVDPSLGGGYTTMNGLDVYLSNNPPGLPKPLFDYLRDEGIDLIRCVVKLFVVEDGVFRQWGEYQVSALENQEHLLKLDTWHIAAVIHKDTLKVQVSREGFPEAPDESIGKWIPLTIGRVPSAKMLPLNGQVVFEPLMKLGEAEFNSAPILSTLSGSNGKTVVIQNTVGFVTNDSRLVGRYMKVVVKGMETVDVPAVLITASFPVGEDIRISISSAFKGGNAPTYNPTADSPNFGWWITVYKLESFGALSDGPVVAMPKPLLGEKSGKLVNIEGRKIRAYPDADGIFPYAGVTSLPEGEFSTLQPDYGFLVGMDAVRGGAVGGKTVLPDARWEGANQDAELYENNVPMKLYMKPVEVLGPKAYPAPGGSLALLTSRVKTTSAYYERGFDASATVEAGSVLPEIIDAVFIDLPFPKELLLEETETLAVALDADFLGNFVGFQNQIGLRVWISARLIGLDGKPASPEAVKIIAGRGNTASDWTITFSGNGGAVQYTDMRQCGPYYYTGEGEDSKATELVQGATDIAVKLRDRYTRDTVKGIRVKLVYEFAQLTPGEFVGPKTWITGHKLYQLAVYRKSEAYEGSKFHYVTGVTYTDSWGGRRTPGEPILRGSDAIEYLIRERDGAPERIDTASFDEVHDSRPDTFQIGRQINEQEKTQKLIDQIAQALFLAVVPGRDGKLRLKRLDGYDNSQGVYDEAVNIVKGSVKESPIEGLDRVYTGLELKYDQHPETGEYQATVFIHRTHESTFPAEDMVDPGSRVPLWTLYAGGFKSYVTGRYVWGLYRQGYLLANQENILKREVPWFQRNTKIQPGAEVTLPPSDPAEYMAVILGEWFSGPRVSYTFEVPYTSENAENLQLLASTVFRDQKRTSGLYFNVKVESVSLMPKENMIEATVSRRLKDVGYAENPEPLYIRKVIGGDTITETIGGDTITATIH